MYVRFRVGRGVAEADAEKARTDVQGDAEAEALKKQPTTLDLLARRARRLTTRLASMETQCFWLPVAGLQFPASGCHFPVFSFEL